MRHDALRLAAVCQTKCLPDTVCLPPPPAAAAFAAYASPRPLPSARAGDAMEENASTAPGRHRFARCLLDPCRGHRGARRRRTRRYCCSGVLLCRGGPKQNDRPSMY